MRYAAGSAPSVSLTIVSYAGTKPLSIVGKATALVRWTSAMPASLNDLKPPGSSFASGTICASERCSPTFAAAFCTACSGASDGFAASVSSPWTVPAAEITFQPPAFLTPIVTRPPPEASRPPTFWRSVTAWPASPASLESLTSSRPSVEPRRNSALLSSSHTRAATVADAPGTPAASVPPGSTSDDGVPN